MKLMTLKCLEVVNFGPFPVGAFHTREEEKLCRHETDMTFPGLTNGSARKGCGCVCDHCGIFYS